MDLDVRRLMMLRAVRDAGGVLAAAAALGITASAVSQQLSKLEQESGLRLLDRAGTGKAHLTSAGVRLAEGADAIARELSAIRVEVELLAGAQDSTVTVGVLPSAIESLVLPVVDELRAGEPSVSLRIVESRDVSPATIAALRAGTLDLAIVTAGVSLPEGMVQTTIRDDPYRIVVPSGWQRASSLRDLADVAFIGSPAGTAARDPLDRVAAAAGRAVRVEHESADFSVALAMVAAGLGAAVVPELAMGGEPPTGVAVLSVGDLGHRSIVAVHARDRYSAGIAATLDALRG